MSTGGSNNPSSSGTEESEQLSGLTGNEPAIDHEEGPSTSKKTKFFHVDSSRIKSVPLSEQAAELKDLGLFSVYDQQELEQGIIQQVDNAIHVEEEKQAKKHAEKELKTILNEIRSTKEELNHIDKVMRNIVLPSGHSFGNKDSHRQLVSIKSQKEVKKKQLKKLRSRHQFLLASLGRTQDGLQEDLLQDEGETQADEGLNILRNLLTDGQSKAADKETEEERMIRLGEMTPFGTTLKQVSRQPVAPPPLTDFEKYMMEQAELASKKKSLHGKKKGIKRKENTNNKKYIEKKLKEECNQKSEDKLEVNSLIEDKREISPVNSEDEFLYMEERCHSKTLERSKNITNWQSDSEVSGVQSSGDEYNPELDDWKSDNETYSGNKYNNIKPKKKKSSISSTQLINIKGTKRKKGSKEKQEKSTKLKRKTQDDGNKEMFYKRLRKNKKARLREKQTKIENGEVDSDSGDEEDVEFDGGWRLPQRIWKKLYRYQQTGVKWLWELHQQECGGIIGDEMGLGKTIQIIAFLAGLKHSKLYNKSMSYNGLGPVLIICPTTVMHQWLKEFHTWWPHFRVAILHDSGSFHGSKACLVQDIMQSHGVLVTSYSGARINKDILLKYKWHYVILDEGHMIRNPNAEVTVVCKQFRTCHRLILSGSPVQNNLKELWSLIDFVFPGKLGTLPDFMQQFSIPITMGGYANATAVQVQTAYKCACVLRDTINPYLLRRMKDDVKKSMKLPPKNEQVLFCRLTNEQRSTYEEYLKSKECQMILNRDYQVFAGLITLRKICNHPDLSTGGPRVPDGEDEDSNPRYQFGYWKRSGKMIVIESLLKIWKEQNHKVLLFSQSKQMLDILEYFVRDKYKYMRMDGSMGISSRQPAINKFNTDPSIFLFLLTTRVGGIGVNLTGANRIIIFDPDWNPSTDTQARERAWRIGQNRHVTIYRLLTTGTIEEKIYHRQIFKQFLTNRVLKDPKQRRFFKSNDLFELFTLGTDDNVHGTETNALFAGTGANIESTAKESDIKPHPVKRESVLNRTFKKYKPQSTTSKQQHSNKNIPSTTVQSSGKRNSTGEMKTNQNQVFLKQAPHSADNIALKMLNPNNAESNDINIENGSDKVKKSLKNDNPLTKGLQIDQEPSNVPGNGDIPNQNNEQSSFSESCNKREDKESIYQNNDQMFASALSNIQEEKEPIQSNKTSRDSMPSEQQEEKEPVCQSDNQRSANQPEETKTTQEKDEESISKVSYNKPEDITEWKAREMKKIEKLKKKLLKIQNESKKEKMLTKRKKKNNKRKKAKDACLEGKQIAYLSRHSTYEQSNSKVDSAKQDDYVLQKLFKKNGVQSAMKHDVIMQSSNPDYLLVEKEAERVAKEAAIALKRSRRRCMPASSGIPTWTGSIGGSGMMDKPRFGLKKNSKLAEVNLTTSPAKKEESKRKFGSKKLFNGSMSGHTSTKTSAKSSALPSSAELLSTIRARNDITDDASIGNGPANEKTALLQDLHAFISFQANVDGQATTDEILQRFKGRIPREDSVVFRSLLHEICDSTKMPDGKTVWRLRPSFR